MDRTAFDILGTDNDEDGMPRYYQIGRMDMLFGLVNAGKLTLDEAADFIGMAWGDAADMLQGWIESRWR